MLALSIRSGLSVPWPRKTSSGLSPISVMASLATRTKTSPMILRFSSGLVVAHNILVSLGRAPMVAAVLLFRVVELVAVSAASVVVPSMKLWAARTTRNVRPNWLKLCSTCVVSFLRINPLSMCNAITCSLLSALWHNAAHTVESTPPLTNNYKNKTKLNNLSRFCNIFFR